MSKTMRAVLRSGVGVALLMALADRAAAQERPWPDFALTRATDGATLQSTAITHSEQWLVVVVRPRCAPCRTLLRQLSREGAASLPGRVAVILSGVDAAEAAALQVQAGGLPPSAWYRDDAGAAVSALPAANAPTLVGLRGDSIAWTFGGYLYSDAKWRSVVVPWLR